MNWALKDAGWTHTSGKRLCVEWRGVKLRENVLGSKRGLGGSAANSVLVLGAERNARHFIYNIFNSQDSCKVGVRT